MVCITELGKVDLPILSEAQKTLSESQTSNIKNFAL